MQVFKTYFKIIRRHMGQISIYMGVFLVIAIISSFSSSTDTAVNFTESKSRVAFINEDQNSVLVEGFRQYLGQYSVYVPIEDDNVKLQDALFFRDVEYIAKIPKGFTNYIMAGNFNQIQKTVVVGSASGTYTNMLVNKYFNTVKLYLDNNKGITQDELVKQVMKDLSNQTNVQLSRVEKTNSSGVGFRFFFDYLAYIQICIIMLGVTSIMMVFNKKDIRRRNLCSPIKNSSLNLQISVVCWCLMMGLSFVLHKERMFSENAVYYCINSFVFTIMVLCLSFLVGIFVKSNNAQSGITNIIGLGFSFISGVFVPQEVLSESVLRVARFTPTYWYVKANKAIADLSNFSFDNLVPIFQYMLIELGFAAALLSVALVASKRKQMSEN
jgi:ABC-2 type transport system permease protein